MVDLGASIQARSNDGAMPQALILADSSTAMGQGHLMRCQTLALALLRQGWQVILCGQALPGHGLERAVEFFTQEHVAVECFDAQHMDVETAPATMLRVQILAPLMPFTPEQRAADDSQRLLAMHVLPLLQRSALLSCQSTQLESARPTLPATLVLVDHYSIDAPFYHELRRQQPKLLLAAIDDLANRQLPVDVLLDQNFQAPDPRRVADAPQPGSARTASDLAQLTAIDQNVQTPWRYQSLLPAHCLTLIGPQYALLRDEFVQRRVEPTALMVSPTIRRLLISFGGSDPDRFTEQVLTALCDLYGSPASLATTTSRPDTTAAHSTGKPLPQTSSFDHVRDCQIDVVVGRAYPALPALEALVALLPQAKLHIQTQQMAQLIASADLCIGATGGSTWERALLGCPTIAYWLAPNQRPALEALAQVGAIINAGPAATFDAVQLQQLLTQLDQPKRQALALKARQLMGKGTGAATVASTLGMLLKSHLLQCRPVVIDDAELLLHWANDPDVRSQGFNPEPISMATHLAWLERRLAAADELFYIISQAGTPIAQVRFSPKTDYHREDLHSGAEIHVSLAREARGQGLAAAVLQAAICKALASPVAAKWQFIDALVRCSNLASSVSFRRAGFVEFSDTDVKGIPCRWLRRFILESRE
ncbi:MAG TPA: hypothetical protein DCS87_06245 [Rheinheimera sp.]|nr:hypothetical protein [Rheinheimera sp.]